MRPTYKPPVKKKYFHKKRKIDKKDMASLKKRIDLIKQDKRKLELEKNKKKLF